MSPVLKVTNPYDGAALGDVPIPTDQELGKIVTRGAAAAKAWARSTSAERHGVLTAVAQGLTDNRETFVTLISKEAGKPRRFAEVEVDRAIGVFHWAAGEALRFGGKVLRLDTTKNGRPGMGIVTRFPRGLILGITPFNFPLNLVAHKVAPALASGNTILVKPSPQAPLTALELAGLVEKHAPGLNLMGVVAATDEQTARLTAAPEVAMVSFTGSARVGWLIREQAPKKPVTLELGGNAWCLIAPDVPEADLPGIARRVAGAAYGYAGQSCISVQNVACAENLWPAFRDAMVAATQAPPYGNPADPAVVCGPLINGGARARIEKDLATAKGRHHTSVKLVGAGDCKTLLAPVFVEDADPSSPLVREEVFGPVATGRAVSTTEDALRLVNASHYGLQAGLYTNDLALIERAYEELHVGGLIINDVPTTRYDHQPYGGVKDSGFGREGLESAMEEMTEPKFLALGAGRVLG